MSKKNSAMDDMMLRLVRLSFDGDSGSLSEDDLGELQSSDSVQFLAKLHLVAIGNMRQSHVIENLSRSSPRQIIQAEANMPVGLAMLMSEWSRRNTPASFVFRWDEIDMPNPDAARFVSASVSVDACKVIGAANIALLDDERYTKRVAAAGMLETLAITCSAPDYKTNPGTLAIQRKDGSNLVSAFVDGILDGKVSACPACGRVVYKPRATSTPYCSPGCKTAFNNKAHDMYLGGASVDEVYEAFNRHIGKSTISKWLD